LYFSYLCGSLLLIMYSMLTATFNSSNTNTYKCAGTKIVS